MSALRDVRRRPISVVLRLMLAALAVATGGMLATARSLAPDARGWGTHEQLGWAPCWMRMEFGVACPSCGMTTAWAHAMRGQWRQAAACNASGLLLWAAAAAATPWLLTAAALGRWPIAVPRPAPLLYIGTAIVAVTTIDWLRRILLT